LLTPSLKVADEHVDVVALAWKDGALKAAALILTSTRERALSPEEVAGHLRAVFLDTLPTEEESTATGHSWSVHDEDSRLTITLAQDVVSVLYSDGPDALSGPQLARDTRLAPTGLIRSRHAIHASAQHDSRSTPGSALHMLHRQHRRPTI